MKKQVQIEVSKETHDVATLICEVVVALIQKKPVAEIAAGELTSLKEAIDGVTAIPGEFSEDGGAFSLAVAEPMAKIWSELTKKKEVAPEPAPAV